MSKTFVTGFFLGRMQPIHLFHEKLILAGQQICDQMIVMIGSAQESGTIRNPLPIELRMRLSRQIFGEQVLLLPLNDMSNERDATFGWGDYLIEHIRSATGKIPELMIYGNEESRQGWFRPGVFESMGHLVFPRPKDGLSSTQIRELVMQGDKRAWMNVANEKIHKDFEEIRQFILSAK